LEQDRSGFADGKGEDVLSKIIARRIYGEPLVWLESKWSRLALEAATYKTPAQRRHGSGVEHLVDD